MISINLMPKECKLYLGKHAIDFRHYDEPEKASNITKKYLSRPINVTDDCVRIINDIVLSHRKCVDLDLAFDAIFSRGRRIVSYPHIQYGGGSGSPSDPDADGSWGNAVRLFEENTCHGCF